MASPDVDDLHDVEVYSAPPPRLHDMLSSPPPPMPLGAGSGAASSQLMAGGPLPQGFVATTTTPRHVFVSSTHSSPRLHAHRILGSESYSSPAAAAAAATAAFNSPAFAELRSHKRVSSLYSPLLSRSGGVGGGSNGEEDDEEDEDAEDPTRPPARLIALDLLRGLGVLAMLLALEWGGGVGGASGLVMEGAGHALDSAAWGGAFGFADVVQPLLLFALGAGAAVKHFVALRRAEAAFQAGGAQDSVALARREATRTIVARSLKLFVLGIVTCSGTFPTDYPLARLRVPGFLQRAAFVYATVALAVVWIPSTPPPLVLVQQQQQPQQQQHVSPRQQQQQHQSGNGGGGGGGNGGGGSWVYPRFYLARSHLAHLLFVVGWVLAATLLTFYTDLSALGPACNNIRGNMSPQCNAAVSKTHREQIKQPSSEQQRDTSDNLTCLLFPLVPLSRDRPTGIV